MTAHALVRPAGLPRDEWLLNSGGHSDAQLPVQWLVVAVSVVSQYSVMPWELVKTGMDSPLTVAWPIRTEAMGDVAALVAADAGDLALAVPQPAASSPIARATPAAVAWSDADPRNHTVESPLSR